VLLAWQWVEARRIRARKSDAAGVVSAGTLN
jgi:hypothetical protein